VDRVLETRKHWEAVGTLAFWVILYFWAVWFFNQMLPEVPEQTPVEVILQQRLGGYRDGGDAPDGQSPAVSETYQRTSP